MADTPAGNRIVRLNLVYKALLAFFRRLERGPVETSPYFKVMCQFCHDSPHKSTCELKQLIDVLEQHSEEVVG